MKKLNLGCAHDYKKGWVNLDARDHDASGKKMKVDVIHNLNKYPWPFKNEEFDFIYLRGVLEFLTDQEKAIKELRRISSKGSEVKIIVPYFTSYFAYREFSAHKYSLNCTELLGYFKRQGFELISKGFENNNSALRIPTALMNLSEATQNFYERLFSGIFPANQVYWVIKKRK